MRYSDTNNIQSSHHRQADIRSFIKASDRQRIDALIHRAKRCGYYDSELPRFDELCDNADEQLFDSVRRNSHHTLHNLLPRYR